MTYVEEARKWLENLEAKKAQALKDGSNTVEYIDLWGNTRHLYYHSLRWNDRPSSVAKYRA